MNVRLAFFLLCAAVGAQACDSSVMDAPHGTEPPPTPPKIVSVAAGAHTCAISDVGAAYCWGYDASGPFGASGSTKSPMSVASAGGLVFKALSVSKIQNI